MKTRQSFDTIDRLDLEVGRAPAGLRNLVENPSGERGPWGWNTPDTDGGGILDGGSRLSWDTNTDAEPTLFFDKTTSIAAAAITYVESDPYPVTAGRYVRLALRQGAVMPSNQTVELSIRFYAAPGDNTSRAAGTYLSSSAVTTVTTASTTGAIHLTATTLVPATATSARIRIQIKRSVAGTRSWRWNKTMLAEAATSAELSGLAYVPRWEWVDVLGKAYEIEVDRAALNLGTLNAYLRDATIDPSQVDLIRPGNPVRLLANVDGGTTRHPLFWGEIDNGKVEYDALAHPDATKRAKVTLIATDAIQKAANTPAPYGVATISDLKAVVESTGIPWWINYAARQTASPSPPAVSFTERASVVDQIAMTRDTQRGQAWVDRFGVMRILEPAAFDPTRMATLGPSSYSSAAIDYDTARCINTLIIKRRYITTDGQAAEEVHGPYTSPASVAKWGPYQSEMTVHGLTPAQVDALGAQVIAANGTPKVRLNGIRMPVTEAADFAWRATEPPTHERRVHLDVYDLVRVTNANAGIDEDVRITRIQHRIAPRKWTIDLGFEPVGGVAMPTRVPDVAPASSTLGKFADTAWTDVAPLYGWTNFGGGYQGLQVRRLGGMVHWRGLVIGTARTDETIANIPVGFRHGGGTQVWDAFNDAGGVTRLDTTASGLLFRASGSAGWVSLAGISYPAEA